MTMKNTPLGAIGDRLAKLPQTRPVAADQIRAFEKTLDAPLPATLSAFFQIAGDDYDFLFGGGTRARFASLAGIADEAREILDECGGVIERPYLPFLTYSGSMFLFVYPDDGDDPPVYRFDCDITGDVNTDLPNGVVQSEASFTAMLDALVAERENLAR
jgi:hypothetical protein